MTNDTNGQNLPARSPDLIFERGGANLWRARLHSKALSELLRIPVAGPFRELPVNVFSSTVPSLNDLADDVARDGAPLSDVRIMIPSQEGTTRLVVDVVPWGLSSDYRGISVAFFFRRAPKDDLPLLYHGMVGTSPAMREVFRKIALYAPSDASVVITGETGTGKELAARALHDASPRSSSPYVAVNCSAISEELLESELFGHEKGAFTGAVRTHRGRFERADGGTLFLDELGEMPLHTQSKLLRVLEEGKIERVGAEEERRIDVRVIAATNIPLERAVGNRSFRADLYHRLSVLRIHLPSLRERPEDIPLLVTHFLEAFSRKYRRRIDRLTPEALHLLQSYLWPGNIRELRNVLERVFVETQADVIGAKAFGEWIRERRDFASETQPLSPRHAPVVPPYPLHTEQKLIPVDRHSTRPAELDVEEIRRAYAASGGNISGAARLLGVHRATLYRYLERFGLDRKSLDRSD